MRHIGNAFLIVVARSFGGLLLGTLLLQLCLLIANDVKVPGPNFPGHVEKPAKDEARELGFGPDYHIVFSTSCSSSQDWESYVFFYHALKVNQPGNVTRIVSGCNEQEHRRVQSFFDKYITTMRDDGSFHLHFTPGYSRVQLANGNEYKYNNKPFGLRHWMEHSLGMGITDTPSKRLEDAIVFLFDPDFVLLRPISHDFTDIENHIWVEETPRTRVVRHGYPIAQQDGYLSNRWMTLDIAYITNKSAGEYVPIPPEEEGPLHYNSGPPYLATVRDMYKIAKLWTEYAPRITAKHPHLFSEMQGLIYATLQLKLPFTMIKSLTVSFTKSTTREGWEFVDRLSDDQICMPPPGATLPLSIHFCKDYSIGKYYWSKYRLKENILDCDQPLLRMPPADLPAQNLTYMIEPPGIEYDALRTYKEVKTPLKKAGKLPWHPLQPRRIPFMLCHLTRAVNEAVRYHKNKACPDGGNLVENYTVYNYPWLR